MFLTELKKDELKKVSGGNWMYEAGKWAHEQWCSFKDFVSDCGLSASQSADYQRYRGM